MEPKYGEDNLLDLCFRIDGPLSNNVLLYDRATGRAADVCVDWEIKSDQTSDRAGAAFIVLRCSLLVALECASDGPARRLTD